MTAETPAVARIFEVELLRLGLWAGNIVIAVWFSLFGAGVLGLAAQEAGPCPPVAVRHSGPAVLAGEPARAENTHRRRATMNWSKTVPPPIGPVPSDRHRSREVLNEPDDPVGRARDGRKGDWTKLQLMNMDARFVQAMRRAGHASQ